MDTLKIRKLHTDAVLPTRAHHDDAGIDLYTYKEVILPPHATMKIHTGISLAIPTGFVGLIWDKSSVSSKGIKTVGGVIDAQYRGELIVALHNLNDETYVCNKGDKVAQMLIQKVEFFPIEEVQELDETDRGVGGFGSTGK
jgi:dUTP pyrophosphatase